MKRVLFGLMAFSIHAQAQVTSQQAAKEAVLDAFSYVDSHRELIRGDLEKVKRDGCNGVLHPFTEAVLNLLRNGKQGTIAGDRNWGAVKIVSRGGVISADQISFRHADGTMEYFDLVRAHCTPDESFRLKPIEADADFKKNRVWDDSPFRSQDNLRVVVAALASKPDMTKKIRAFAGTKKCETKTEANPFVVEVAETLRKGGTFNVPPDLKTVFDGRSTITLPPDTNWGLLRKPNRGGKKRMAVDIIAHKEGENASLYDIIRDVCGNAGVWQQENMVRVGYLEKGNTWTDSGLSKPSPGDAPFGGQ